MTITLSVRAPSVTNSTNVTCVTFVGNVKNTVNGTIFLQVSSYVYKHIAMIHLLSSLCIDVPYFKETNVTYHENNRAVLELGDMFYGGGVPINHYIIQVEDGTVLETPGPTYSFDIMYNTSLSVNISAHNCAGYSDPFPLVLQYDEVDDEG